MTETIKVCAITATKNRHRSMERSLGLFLNQTYKNCVQLIFNNSCTEQSLDESVPKDRVILINQCVDSVTNQPYTNLGAIYNDAIKHIPSDCDVVCFWDDDDIFLVDHIANGVSGYLRAREQGKLAYKPKKSYFKSGNITQLAENTLEPSIFVHKDHVLQYGFSNTTSDQHLAWVNGLVYNNKILVDPNGEPTLIYNWGDDLPAFKTSGNAGNPDNFKNYENFSQDIGDQVITPYTVEQLNKYYYI